MKKKRSYDIIESTYHTLDFAILRGCVRTRKSKDKPVGFGKIVKVTIVELPPPQDHTGMF